MLIPALVLGAQAASQDSLATLTGIVRSARDGQPVAAVMVSIKGRGPSPGAFSVSDSTGRFRIVRIAPGAYTLRFSYSGQTAEDYQIGLPPGRSMELSILLDVKGVDLAPIVVEGGSQDYALSLAGFYARKGHGLGRYVTRDEIDRRHPANLSQMLSGTGITMRCQRTACVPVRMSSGRRCAISVFLDGIRVENYNIDMIPPEDVLGLEVYRQGADTPAEFSRYSADCGALVIWTKN
jgi:hypothetical protein